MTDPQRPHIRRLFMDIADLPPSDRAQALAQIADPALRAEVERLLAADRNAAGFMANPTNSVNPPTNDQRLLEGPGTRIGPYKLLELIGEGGFGSVFMAEQDQPIRRRVALKVIKPGMDSRMVAARFEAERQALALMDHPHIARVLDGGITDAALGSRPYFVMEYVRGEPITKFADAHKLPITDRLTLFTQVCEAVQHAHQKGIIHRDLKPSNVLVSMTDGRPFARVIDFGIAKSLASRLTDKTLFTEHRQLIGTPEYMSPEQAEGSPDIDTRADVYGLGVLLYELLTGLTPFDGARLRSAAFAEMQRIIKEEEPPAPSIRMTRALGNHTLGSPALRAGSSSPGGPAVPAGRISSSPSSHSSPSGTDPFTLPRQLKGELDWIVMKALDKDRARRYETPNQLAADVRRHLAGEAVVAAPPSAGYRIRKFVRRNRGAVVAGSAVLAALALGGGVATWQWSVARHNAANAQLAREQAELERDTVTTTLKQVAAETVESGYWSYMGTGPGRPLEIGTGSTTDKIARIKATFDDKGRVSCETWGERSGDGSLQRVPLNIDELCSLLKVFTSQAVWKGVELRKSLEEANASLAAQVLAKEEARRGEAEQRVLAEQREDQIRRHADGLNRIASMVELFAQAQEELGSEDAGDYPRYDELIEKLDAGTLSDVPATEIALRTALSRAVVATDSDDGDAGELLDAALKISDRAFGPDHRTSLRLLSELSTYYYEDEEGFEPLREYSALLVERLRRAQPGSSELLRALMELAYAQTTLDEADPAPATYCEALLIAAQLKLDDESSALLWEVLSNLADYLLEGPPEDAQCLPDRLRPLSAAHPSALAVLAMTHFQLGSVDKARTELAQLRALFPAPVKHDASPSEHSARDLLATAQRLIDPPPPPAPIQLPSPAPSPSTPPTSTAPSVPSPSATPPSPPIAPPPK